jgi:hypothetical protein
MPQIHNFKMRRPTILTKDLAAEWISDVLSEEQILKVTPTKS